MASKQNQELQQLAEQKLAALRRERILETDAAKQVRQDDSIRQAEAQLASLQEPQSPRWPLIIAALALLGGGLLLITRRRKNHLNHRKPKRNPPAKPAEKTAPKANYLLFSLGRLDEANALL